jgi:hypothetical protein
MTGSTTIPRSDLLKWRRSGRRKRDDVRWRKEEGRWMRDSKGMTMYKEK